MSKLVIEIDVDMGDPDVDMNAMTILRKLANKIADTAHYGVEGVNCMPLFAPDGLLAGGVWLRGDPEHVCDFENGKTETHSLCDSCGRCDGGN